MDFSTYNLGLFGSFPSLTNCNDQIILGPQETIEREHMLSLLVKSLKIYMYNKKKSTYRASWDTTCKAKLGQLAIKVNLNFDLAQTSTHDWLFYI